MENTEQATLVFKDREGEYYLLPQALLERGRVPEEHKAALEAEIAAMSAATAGDDVQGQAVAHAALGAGAVLFGYWIGWNIKHNNEEQDVPTLDYSGVGSREPLPAPGGGRF